MSSGSERASRRTMSWYDNDSDNDSSPILHHSKRRVKRSPIKMTPQGVEHQAFPGHAQTPNPAWMRVAQIAMGLIALGVCITIVVLSISVAGALVYPLYLPLIAIGTGLVASFALFCYLTYRIDCRENYVNNRQVQKAYSESKDLRIPPDVQQVLSQAQRKRAQQTRAQRKRAQRKRAQQKRAQQKRVAGSNQSTVEEGCSTHTRQQNFKDRQHNLALFRDLKAKETSKPLVVATTRIAPTQQELYKAEFIEQDFASVYQARLVDLRLERGTKLSRLTPVSDFNGIHAEIPALLQYDVQGSVYYQTPLVVRLPKEYIQNMSILPNQKERLLKSETEFYFIVYRPNFDSSFKTFQGTRRNLSFHGPILASRQDKHAEFHANISMGMLYAKGVKPLPPHEAGTSIPMGQMQKQPQSIHPVGGTGDRATSPNNAAFLVSDDPVDTFFACANLDPKADRSMAVFGVVLNDVSRGDGQAINDALMVDNLDAFYQAIAGQLSDQDVLSGIGAALNLPHTAPTGVGVGI